MKWNDYLLNRWNKMSLERCFSLLVTTESLEDQYCSGQQRSNWAILCWQQHLESTWKYQIHSRSRSSEREIVEQKTLL